MLVLSRRELLERSRKLANFEYCQNPLDIALSCTDRIEPREDISTREWSTRFRKIRKEDGTQTDWSRKRTPYLVDVMNALDDPAVLEVIVPKPSRCGGTMVAENFALKCLDYGPAWSVMWYLAGPTEVSSYADRVLGPMFEDHESVAAKIGTGKSDDTKKFKRLGSQTFELMVMSKTTTTNRQAGFIVFDEPDSYSRDFRSNFLEQGRQRQSDLGTNRKIYACAHADIGWSGGIAAAWLISSQGIFVMRCPQCGTHGSPYPTKHWPEVPRFRLNYEDAPEGTPIDRRLALARETAMIACPNGCALGEKERAQMAEEGSYMHRGQSLDVEAGIIGDPEANATWGFWIHALMSPQVPLSDLAATLVGAIEHRERTGKSDRIKQVLVRTFGEVFEGAADLEGIDAKTLHARAAQEAIEHATFPMEANFVTAAVDVGGGKFDVSFRAWDLESRSWWLDRLTLRQRKWEDGKLRDIRPADRIEDWLVLIDDVILRRFAIEARPGWVMPVAQVTIDVSDGNVTHKGREFAARCIRQGLFWGTRTKPWGIVQLVQGSPKATAPLLPPKPRLADAKGKRFPLGVQEWTVGAHEAKELALDRLAITDGGPGQCFFANSIARNHFEEYFNEPLIDGKFVRQGPNESLDLFGMEEEARLMLKPERRDRLWNQSCMPEGQEWHEGLLPPWARPISLIPKGGDPDAGGKVAEAAGTSQAVQNPWARLNTPRAR